MEILNNKEGKEIARGCLKMEEAKAEPAAPQSKARATDEVYKDEMYGFKSDNLQLVEGIGPKINQLLAAAGIITWRQLSKEKAERLKDILTEAGPRFQMHDPSSWPTQAGFAADGKWEEMIEFLSSGAASSGSLVSLG